MSAQLEVREEPAVYKSLQDIRTIRLGDVALSMKNGIYKAKDAYADDGTACLRMYNIEDGRIVWKDIKRMTLSDQERMEYALEPGDLLVNRVNSRELVGKTALVTQATEPAVFESKNIRVRLDRRLVDPAYVNYALLGMGHTHFNRNAQQVVGMASVSQPQVAAFEFLWRPVLQQREVVAYLDEQLSRLDTSVAALHRVQANLKRYRASVLKAACDGRLVPTEAELARQEGREFENGDQLMQQLLADRRRNWPAKRTYEAPAEPSQHGYDGRPTGWRWATVGQLVCERLCNGLSVKGSDTPPGVRALKLNAMNVDGFDYEQSRYLPVSEESVSDILIRGGDYFVSRGNGSLDLVGRGTLAQSPPGPVIFPDTMIRLRFAPAIASTQWIRSIWESRLVRRQIERKVKTTAGIFKISQPELESIVVPLPPLAEQHRIVAEADRRLSLIRAAEATVAASLARAQRLRQAILQAAFAEP